MIRDSSFLLIEKPRPFSAERYQYAHLIMSTIGKGTRNKHLRRVQRCDKVDHEDLPTPGQAGAELIFTRQEQYAQVT